MTNPNPVAPKTDTPATQIPGDLKDRYRFAEYDAEAAFYGSEVRELIERIWRAESTLAAERASRLQAEDQAWNKAVIQGIKKMIHWNPATDQEPDDVLRELLRPCTSETHIWNSGECMACDVVKDRLKFAKPSVSPEQAEEGK